MAQYSFETSQICKHVPPLYLRKDKYPLRITCLCFELGIRKSLHGGLHCSDALHLSKVAAGKSAGLTVIVRWKRKWKVEGWLQTAEASVSRASGHQQLEPKPTCSQAAINRDVPSLCHRVYVAALNE